MERKWRPRVDPITFEILRHRFWAINTEAATTVRLVSGSPVATEAQDMNTGLMNAQGDVFMVAPLSMAKATTMSDVVKDILSNYQENPGIRPGDGFLCNDPYLGVQHQNDVALVMPIHADGTLIAWAGAEIHQVDVGGAVAGQVQVGAADIFGEAPLIPPIKVLEGGELRKDIEREYLRRSRVPGLVGLDLRAKVAAGNVSCQRILTLVAEYGLETVLAAIEDIIDYAEMRFRDRLAGLPDGTWRHRTYIDFNGKLYPLVAAMTKEGDRLIFDFRGSAPQAPATINATCRALIAVVRGYLCPSLCWDIPWCPSALGRAVEVISEQGTIVDARWPAGVSKSTTSTLWTVGRTVGILVGRMLAAADGGRRKAMAGWHGGTPVQDIFGIDQRGQAFGGALLDGLAGGGGARTWADGIDTGGYLGSMAVSIANVESYEFEYPILYLYRRQLCDSGGAGRFRGGAGITMMWTCHDAPEIPILVMHCIGAEVPLSPGISGGYPAVTNRFDIKRSTDLERQFAAGRIPGELDEIAGTLERHPAISRSHLGRGEVFRCWVNGGGGFGDPVDREPERVRDDVLAGLVSEEMAERLCGVVLDAEGDVDLEATAARRTAIRKERLATATIGALRRVSAPVTLLGRLNEALGIARLDGTLMVVCRCGAVICQAAQPYKIHVPAAAYPLGRFIPDWTEPGDAANRLELREYYCPGCATLLETEVSRPDDPLLVDAELHLEGRD